MEPIFEGFASRLFVLAKNLTTDADFIYIPSSVHLYNETSLWRTV